MNKLKLSFYYKNNKGLYKIIEINYKKSSYIIIICISLFILCCFYQFFYIIKYNYLVSSESKSSKLAFL